MGNRKLGLLVLQYKCFFGHVPTSIVEKKKIVLLFCDLCWVYRKLPVYKVTSDHVGMLPYYGKSSFFLTS